MRAAIIQCDSVLSEFLDEFGNYPEMIKHMFASIDATLEYQVFDVQQREYPDDIDAFDFYITTGSRAGAYEEHLWIKQLIEFVQLLDSKQKKLIGICFGHQVIAMARKGKVEKSPKGWGVGVASNRIIARPEWLQTEKQDLNIIVSHQDQISRLPHDAIIIASSDFCPYFVVQWGNHFLSVQGHPEWLREYSRALMNRRRDLIGDKRIDDGLASLAIEPDNTLFTQWILDFVSYRHPCVAHQGAED